MELSGDVGADRSAAGISSMDELLDVVRWLPDLAGDSDMSETDWNVVSDASNKLLMILSDGPSPNPHDLEKQIDRLEMLVQKQSTDTAGVGVPDAAVDGTIE